MPVATIFGPIFKQLSNWGIVTGESQGIGRAIVKELAIEGVRIVFTVLTQESQNGELAKQMAIIKTNPVLNAQQDRLEGLVQTGKRKKA